MDFRFFKVAQEGFEPPSLPYESSVRKPTLPLCHEINAISDIASHALEGVEPLQVRASNPASHLLLLPFGITFIIFFIL